MGGKGIRRNSEIHLWLEKNYVRLICGVKSLNKINTRCDAHPQRFPQLIHDRPTTNAVVKFGIFLLVF